MDDVSEGNADGDSTAEMVAILKLASAILKLAHSRGATRPRLIAAAVKIAVSIAAQEGMIAEDIVARVRQEFPSLAEGAR